MANPACDAFSSIDEVLAQANAGQLNITTFVASCPQTCTLAWGTGNPDLSGIGANISYILQAVLTFIFCPLFCLLYWCLNRWKVSKDTKDKLEKLQDTFLDISAQFSIPVAVAAVIRFRQHAPFYELAFLRTLTTMQFLSLLSSTVTSGIFEKRKSPLRISVLIAYGLLEFGLYMGLIGGLREGKKSWELLSELGQACKAYNQIEPWIPYIPTHPPGVLAHVTAENFFDLFSRKHWKEALVELALGIAGILGLFAVIGIIVVLVRVLIGRDVRLLGAMSLAFTVGMLVEVVEMERTRNVMKTVTGAQFQDNQWGFGQVISLFLWAPLCLQSVYQIFSMTLNSLRHRARRTPIPDVEHGIPVKKTKERRTSDNAQPETKRPAEAYFEHVATHKTLDETQYESISQRENETEAETEVIKEAIASETIGELKETPI